MTSPSDQMLIALLDTILPASEDMPGAGTHGLAPSVASDEADSRLGVGLDAVLAALPVGFVEADQAGREAALRLIAESQSANVDAAVNLTYTAYYTDPDVLALIEKRTGYHAGPPQPRGYELPLFDAAALARTRQSAPIWRET